MNLSIALNLRETKYKVKTVIFVQFLLSFLDLCLRTQDGELKDGDSGIRML